MIGKILFHNLKVYAVYSIEDIVYSITIVMSVLCSFVGISTCPMMLFKNTIYTEWVRRCLLLCILYLVYLL